MKWNDGLLTSESGNKRMGGASSGWQELKQRKQPVQDMSAER